MGKGPWEAGASAAGKPTDMLPIPCLCVSPSSSPFHLKREPSSFLSFLVFDPRLGRCSGVCRHPHCGCRTSHLCPGVWRGLRPFLVTFAPQCPSHVALNKGSGAWQIRLPVALAAGEGCPEITGRCFPLSVQRVYANAKSVLSALSASTADGVLLPAVPARAAFLLCGPSFLSAGGLPSCVPV